MDEIKTIDTRDSIRVVTKNNLITAKGLADMSLKARKILYLAISQCEIADDKFYYYEVSVNELAKLFAIGKNHIYESIDKITDELMKQFFVIQSENEGKRNFRKYHLFMKCEFEEDKVLRFKLSDDMKDFLLGIKSNFTQPLLLDLLQMRSVYSMAIWHLIQREVHSQKPVGNKEYCFTLSLDELRQVTGTEKKQQQLVHFKTKILDKALNEYRKLGLADISYTNIKNGRKVIGFSFVAKSVSAASLDNRTKELLDRRIKKTNLLTRYRLSHDLSKNEMEELMILVKEFEPELLSELE